MNKLATFVKGMTKTQKILAGTTVALVVVAGVVGAFYGVKHLKAKKAA